MQPSPLFRRIEDAEINALKSRFAGQTEEQELASMDLTGKSAEEIESLIAEQGDKVRSLKAAKAEKSVVTTEVEKLKSLKAAHAKLVGVGVNSLVTKKGVKK